VVEQNDQFRTGKIRVCAEEVYLYDAMQATRLGMDISIPNFDIVLERYNPHSGTFFTPVREMGLSLHDMWEVSKLPMANLLYEEYFPCDQELRQLAREEPDLYEIYRELMCHFYICMDINKTKGNIIGQKAWADYLFTNLSQAREKVKIRPVASEAEINARLHVRRGDMVMSEDVGDYNEGDTFKRFQHQARDPLSKKAVLAKFFSI